MNKYVEVFKTNTVLDALRFKKPEEITLTEAFGVLGEIKDAFGQLVFGKYRLVLQCDPETAIHIEGSSKDEKKKFIEDNLLNIFNKALYLHSDYIYVLNIAPSREEYSPRWNYPENRWQNLNIQLNIFMPIIHKFILDSITDSLDIKS